MKKLKDFYQGRELCIPVILEAFVDATTKGVKELEMTQEEFRSFIMIYWEQFPARLNVASGRFTFWGIKINGKKTRN